MPRARKATKILEALNEKVEEVPEITPDVPTEPVLPETPVELPPPPQIPPVLEQKPKRKERDPYAEELKKLRKFQEDQEKRIERNLETLIHRKFLEIKSLPQPKQNYQPKQEPFIKRYIPQIEDEYEDSPEESLTPPNSYVLPPPMTPQKPALYNKIFG